jgi:hypothetical protein
MGVNNMNKTITLVGILAVFMLVTLSFASAINTNTANTKKKESPLYRLRTTRAISEKLNTIIKNIKTRFIGKRLFCLPVKLFENGINYAVLYYSCTGCTDSTCQRTWQSCCTTDHPCTTKTCDVRQR